MGASLDTIKSIVRRGGMVSVQSADSSGYTPLMYAAEYGKQLIARFLVACGASREAQNRLSHTAAELADWYGHYDVLKEIDFRLWKHAMTNMSEREARAAAAAASATAEEGTAEASVEASSSSSSASAAVASASADRE
jgi:ankyrin repeat protein